MHVHFRPTDDVLRNSRATLTMYLLELAEELVLHEERRAVAIEGLDPEEYLRALEACRVLERELEEALSWV